MADIALYTHIKKHGGMHRQNPELVRLADATGYTVDHLFKVATQKREASVKVAKSIAVHAQSRSVTVASFGISE